MKNTEPQGFDDLGLNPRILKSLETLKFTIPTPIQAMSLAHALAGSDVKGEAATGSGKTLAFLIPALQKLQESPRSQVLILLPTRELAAQVSEVVDAFQRTGLRLSWVSLVGGTAMMPQLRRLQKNPQIIIGTPGRINDHLVRGSLKFDNIDIFVLDEADRMLDIGFGPQIKKIQSFFARKPQTLLFSATFPKSVQKLTQEILSKPAHVKAVSDSIEKPDITQDAFHMEGDQKFSVLLRQIEQKEGSIIVFGRTQRSVDRLSSRLRKSDVSSDAIHGGLEQRQRKRVLKKFQDQKIRVLVATDVAARGLDIDHINNVINFDLPQRSEDYIHRIGRTGRAGRSGEALSFVTNDDRDTWLEICDEVKKQFDCELPEFFDRRRKFRKKSSKTRRRFGASSRRKGPGGPRAKKKEASSSRGEASSSRSESSSVKGPSKGRSFSKRKTGKGGSAAGSASKGRSFRGPRKAKSARGSSSASRARV